MKYSIFNPQVIQSIKYGLKNDKVMIKTESQIIFLFGADKNNDESNRSIYLKYISTDKNYLKDYFFINAEDFFEIHELKEMDLLSLEEELSYYTDCIVIILESEGTIAELGAFSIKKELSKKILLINDKKYKYSNSFINNGPTKLINKYSKFGSVIYCNFESILTITDIIEKRLTENLRKVRKTRKELKDYSLYTKKDYKKIKLMFISDLITIFSPIKIDELILLLKILYEKDYFFKINIDINILKTLNLIEETHEGYLRSINNNRRQFYEFKNTNHTFLRSHVINYYSKYSAERLTALI